MENINLFYNGLLTEHVAELGFKLNEIVNNFHSNEVFWVDVADDQSAIERHLDAIYLYYVNGFCSDKELMNYLESDDDDELLGIIYTLSSIGDSKNNLVDYVINKMRDCDEDKILMFVIGLRYGKLSILSEKLLVLLVGQSATTRAACVEILGYRGDADPRRIWPAIRDENLAVTMAAIVAMMRLDFKEALPSIEQSVLHSRDTFNEHCLLPLLLLGSQKALQYVRLAMKSPEYLKPQYPIYLAMAGTYSDYPLFVETLKIPEMALSVVEALGIYGSLQGLNILLQQLTVDDAAIKSEAAKSLNLITGAGLKETAVLLQQEESDIDVQDIIGKSEPKGHEQKTGDRREVQITRDCTDYSTWQHWLQKHMSKFDSTQRYRGGKPYSFFSVLSEITHPNTPYSERQRAYYELVIRSGVRIPFEPDWFVDKQIDSLKKWQEWWSLKKTGLTNQWMFGGN